ncbi:3-hydroxybutyryl-CoA dehydrogenase [Novosphingobium sp. Rr 2-17]|uniref:3-hydroxyacyl-CoA dehydrogenase NAD-binding domain-containing protein n=1 Tax=Novosphingobium sp. Rr 2-17 TaxID=555793 RepID=UPI000269A87F|nr:3-hydroxyacyl-CoA dehydrogenase NAD-binding domain-containing protein [Novosphingobium sp. Rr 2-17]EIZ77812.1 3-hydroxybutyryl-CoA dehydrogenase [Novosphingobium sp. Rr 2-17]
MGEVINNIAVCGAGAMGSGIAQVAAQAGVRVFVFDVSADALTTSRNRTLADVGKLIAKGKLTAEQGAQIGERMRWTSDLEQLGNCDLVIEAIIEDADIKAQLFERLEGVLRPDAIIASNTSSLPISRLARSLQHPERFVGMHFFNPATVMRLVEVISGAATAPAVAQRVLEAAQAWGKIAIPVADVPGFIVNRVARPFYAEAFAALNEGAAEPEAIDALFRAAGFRMGPLELTDLIGQDVNFAVARSVFDSYYGRTRFVPQLRQAALVDAGWLGRKSGRGVYEYGDAIAPAAVRIGVAPEVCAEHRQAANALKDAPPGTFVRCGALFVGVTQGLTARQESRALRASVALLDWSPSEGTGPVGFAVSAKEASVAALGTLAAMGKTGVELSDRPGLIVARTLAQLVNAAGDAVLQHVADEAGIDAALKNGANYPFGPFAWADRLGRKVLVDLLHAVAEGTGDPLYNPSQYLRNAA